MNDTALPNVMRYKNPTPKPSPQVIRGLKMYLIRAETAVFSIIVNENEYAKFNQNFIGYIG